MQKSRCWPIIKNMNRAIKTSFQNLWRNKITGVATIAVISILVFIFNIILVVHFTAKNELEQLAKKIDLVIYLENAIEKETGEEIADFTKSLQGVKKSVFISKEEALEHFLSSHPKTGEYYKKFNLENTLPPSIRIMVESPEFYKKIEETMKQSKYAPILTNLNDDQKDLTITGNIIRNLEDLGNFTKYLLSWVLTGFIIGAVLMMQSIIHLHIYTRKNEINIMRLVGAGQKFIQLPYLLEALWISLISLVGTFALFWIVSEVTILRELAFFEKNIKIPYEKIFLLEALVVIFLNLTTSFIAVQREITSKSRKA